MKPLILAIATALPQFSLDQDSIAKKIIEAFKFPNEIGQKLSNLYKKTSINRRYSVLEDIEKPVDQWHFWGKNFPYEVPSTKARNKIYQKEAPKLAFKAAESALNLWAGDRKKITHIISVSCTGVIVPGIEFLLLQKFNLNKNVQRIGINFMGCFGAFKGLAVASALACEDPNNRILLVCTELCSLHMQIGINPDLIVGNAIFSDGAAAAIIGGNIQEGVTPEETPIWSIERTSSYALPDTLDKMTWNLSDNGFVMNLSQEVPNIIKSYISDFTNNILGARPADTAGLAPVKSSDCIWAVHPGGRKIIEVVEQSCELTKDQTQASWQVLADYGNMSSATLLFVLEKLVHTPAKNYILGIGFGPGLSIEGLLLKPVNNI